MLQSNLRHAPAKRSQERALEHERRVVDERYAVGGGTRTFTEILKNSRVKVIAAVPYPKRLELFHKL